MPDQTRSTRAGGVRIPAGAERIASPAEVAAAFDRLAEAIEARLADREPVLVAVLEGVRYRREADGHISHSNLISLLDAEGRLVHQQDGLNAAPDASRSLATESCARSSASGKPGFPK